jgi:MFS family permease
MAALIETSSDRWMRMIRSTGVVGLVTFVVLFAAIIAISPDEPPFLASPEEALAFYLNTAAGWMQAAMAVLGLAAIGWIWFVVGLCLLLARAEGSPPWRSGVALVSGVMLGAFVLLNTSGDAASFGAADLDPAVARYAFDVSSLGFANVWLALGGFAACSGWVVLSTHVVGRWLGWWAIASGLGLVLVRFFWTSWFWFLPYAAFWIWMIIMCIQLVRKPRAVLKAADGRASPGGERP